MIAAAEPAAFLNFAVGDVYCHPAMVEGYFR
jgi:hypothetical protein